MNRTEFQHVAGERMNDAQVLLAADRYSGAYYLAGYVVECALKARISSKTAADTFPPPPRDAQKLYTHNLETLVSLADIKVTFDEAQAGNADLTKNWLLVKDWTEQSRYIVKAQVEATEMVAAVGDPTNGVFQWLKAHW